jgi:ribosomal protein S27E
MSIFILIWLACIATCMVIASRKNNSVAIAFFLGALLGIIGVIIVIAEKPELPAAPRGMYAVKCTRCNAVQNIRPNQPQFECWQCHTVIPLLAPSRPQAIAPQPPKPKAVAAKAAAAVSQRVSVRCFKCEHSQSIPAEQQKFTCEQCGQKLKRKPRAKAS